MPAYVVVDIKVSDLAQYEEYKKLAPAAIAAYGGKYLARGGKSVTLEGDWAPGRLVVLEFESIEKAQTWWSSPEYSAAREKRKNAAVAQMVVVEGI